MKKLCLLIALVFLTTNAYAVILPVAAGQKFAVDDDNTYRDHIDIIVRNFPDDSDPAVATPNVIDSIASEGAIVIWATQSRAIIGRDITMVQIASSNLVAGIISEAGGIASGSFGRMRIYGYFDDVLAADADAPVAQGDSLRTTLITGQAGGGSNFIPSAGVSFGAGSGSNGDEIQAMIRVRQ